MYTIGVLESGGGLSSFLAANLPAELRERVRLCPAASLPQGTRADLLVVSPDLRGEDAAPAVCRALLVPGRLSPLVGAVEAGWAVSYGVSPKDSLSLSSLGEKDLCLSLQREVVTLTGDCLECQELRLPRASRTSPFHVLACAGVQLLLGVPPEEVGVNEKKPAQ